MNILKSDLCWVFFRDIVIHPDNCLSIEQIVPSACRSISLWMMTNFSAYITRVGFRFGQTEKKVIHIIIHVEEKNCCTYIQILFNDDNIVSSYLFDTFFSKSWVWNCLFMNRDIHHFIDCDLSDFFDNDRVLSLFLLQQIDYIEYKFFSGLKLLLCRLSVSSSA